MRPFRVRQALEGLRVFSASHLALVSSQLMQRTWALRAVRTRGRAVENETWGR